MREMLNNKLPRFSLRIVYILHISGKLEKVTKTFNKLRYFLKTKEGT